MKSRPWFAVAGALALGCLVFLAWWFARGGEHAAATEGAEFEPGTARATVSSALSAPSSADPSVLPAGVEREAPAEKSRLRARVEQRLTHAPLPGFDAELVADGIVLGRDTSDARGRIFLPVPPDGGATVRVEAPDGWSVLAPQRAVRADAPEELVFLAGPLGSERFRARLVDAESGEPLSDYMLRLGTRDGRREQLVSDRAGLVASAVDYPEGTLLLFCYDEYGAELGDDQRKPLHYFELEHTIETALAGPHELRLHVGPTYRLELDGPPAALEAPLTADLRYLFDGAPPRPSIGSFLVRAGSPPWVRFPPRYSLFGTHSTVALTISSRDGRWFGATPVPSTVGEHTVAVELAAQGIVVVRVLDPDGNGIPGAHVQLHPERFGTPRAAIARQEAAGNGLVEFRFVPSGRYRVSAAAPGFERRFAPVHLDGGDRQDVALTLARNPRGLTISGRVVGPATTTATAFLVLTSVRPAGGLMLERELSLEGKGNESSASFEFTDLPAGDYELQGYAHGRLTLQPELLSVTAGTRGLVLRLLETGNERWIELAVRDATDDSLLATAWAWFEDSADPEALQELHGPPLVVYPPAGLANETRLGVAAPGFRGALVSLGSARDDGERRLLEVKLERGWSGAILALGPGFAPLAGARVALDGENAGSTDANGRLELVRERAPERIEVDYRGWLVEPDGWSALEALAAGKRGRARVLFTPQ